MSEELYTLIIDRVQTLGDPRSVGSKRDSELLFGEQFAVERIEGRMAYGRNTYDDYQGYVPIDALRHETVQATHRISAPATFWFDKPTMKSAILGRLSMGSIICVRGPAEAGYVPIWPSGYILDNAIHANDINFTNPVDVAMMLVGTPYQWGGRSSYGIDCSGLTQLAYRMCGKYLPRDSDNQVEGGQQLDMGLIERGDLLFAAGHVVLMIDHDTVLHSNATRHGSVAVEPIREASQRYDFHTLKKWMP